MNQEALISRMEGENALLNNNRKIRPDSVDISNAREVDIEKIAPNMTKDSSVPPLDDEFLPAEGGYGWFTVLGAFLVNCVIFGLVFSWGIFQDLYLNDVYKGQTTQLKISFVGTSTSALMLSLGLLLNPVIGYLGIRGTMILGTIISTGALLLASFATQLWQVYITQGILYGIGGSMVFFPSISVPAQWFEKRRGLVMGIVVSGSGVGGLALAPLLQFLITQYGFRTCLRVMAGICFGALCVATLLVKARVPAIKGQKIKIFDSSLLDRKMISLLTFGFLVPFGYLAPIFLLPQYAQFIGLSAQTAAVLTGLLSGFNGLGRVCLGYFADRFGRINAMFCCTLFAALACCLIWSFSKTFAPLLIFAMVYGFNGGGYISLVPTVTADLVGVKNLGAGLGMVYGSNVVGNLLGTPLAGAMLDATIPNINYEPVIQFAGILNLAAATSVFVLRIFVLKENEMKFWSKV